LSTHYIKKLYNFSIYLIGFIVLVSALFATLIRVFLPDFGMYRSEVEAWVSNYMELPVAIHSISAEWVGWTPHLRLEQIDLMDSTGANPILFIGNAHISINLGASIINRQIIPEELVVAGLDMTISRLKDGSINIQGLEPESSSGSIESNNELDNWLLRQNTIRIESANIQWHDILHDQPILHLTNVNLNLQSNLDKILIDGNTNLPSEYGDTMEFTINVIGNLLSSKWSAEVFLKTQNVKPENWYKQYWPESLALTDGNTSISLWSTFKDAKIDNFRGELKAEDYNLYTQNKHVAKIITLDAKISGKQNPTGDWIFNMDLNSLETENGLWPSSTYAVSVNPLQNESHKIISIEYDYLKLNDTFPVLSHFTTPTKPLIENLTGELINGTVIYNSSESPGNKFHLNTTFQNITPAINNLSTTLTNISGKISGGIAEGEISFHDNQAKLNHLTGEDLINLNGVIEWEKPVDTYKIRARDFTLKNNHINVSLESDISWDPELNVDLNVSILNSDVTHVINYMPYTNSFRARDWLKRSISSGLLRSFQLDFNGKPSQFPHGNDFAAFNAKADIENININYSDRYPEISNIDANVEFNGLEMLMHINDGQIFEANINSAKAYIPNLYLKEKLLTISGTIDGKPKDLKYFIDQSPLSNDTMISTINRSLMPEGNISLELDMSIPIRNPEHKLKINGNMNFQNASIQSNEVDLELTGLSGDLIFTESSLTANDLDAVYDNATVTLDISGSKFNNTFPANITLSGNADSVFISKQLNKYLPNSSEGIKNITTNLSGYTNWDASIIYSKDSDNKELQRQLIIKSNLIGLELNLPQPLTKKGYESTSLYFSKHLGSGNDNHITFNLGNIYTTFAYKYSPSRELQNISISTNNRNTPSFNEAGIYISGNYDSIDTKELLSLLTSKDINKDKKTSLPVNVDIKASKLLYLGQVFKDISIKGKTDQNYDWDYVLDSKAIKGTLKVAKIKNEGTHVIADLEHLLLTSNDSSNESSIDPSQLPTLFANVKKFNYNSLDLGTLTLTALPSDSGLLIEEFTFRKPQLHIQATGKWSKNRYTGSMSNFFINVHSSEFKDILNTFEFDDNFISKAETNIIIDANWPGGPSEFSLAKLNGTINLDINKGHMLDIQPAAGRLFGFLSLQALPRRMVLDFSDLFGEGMAFDNITGLFNIKEGNAYTDNLTMRGPSVKVDISGRAGLLTQDYDQTAIVTPQISDSLAVASGFLGPVGIGLGTVLYLAGNMFEPLQDSINKILKIEYTIKGSWSDPVIERAVVNKDS
jgi:uncharacterized protein (TIGR02099 family)